ncbi:hypothetical protein ANO11243_080800 [Dothideomycetidae sp. 11243]|nr:hypothetical protein ANO11243_080800 [fungal sp. No.11243]
MRIRKEDPKTPIAGLTSARTLNACQCLLSSPQICQSAPARSLLKDPAATPFCLSVLKIPTATATEYISSYETVPSTIVDYATVPVTKVHEEVKTTEIAHTVTNYIANVTTKCGVNTKRIKRGASTTAKVPKYMSSEPAAYRSKACKCVTDLVAPTTTITSTIIATQNVISTIIDPILITVDVTSVSTQDATTTITVNATSTVDGGTAVTDDTTTVNSNDYDLYEETAPVNISTNALANCPCSASGGDKCDGYGGTPAFSCAGLKDCLKICGYINSHMGTTTCFSAVYESDTGTCTFVSETYFDSASSCAFINAVNYTIGVLET